MVKRTVLGEKWGLYFWELPSGKYLQNENGDYLNIPATYGDIKAQITIRNTAGAYGFPEGKPAFIPGKRRVTQSEYEDQMERMLDGKVPDWEDPAILEQVSNVNDRTGD